MNPQIEAIHSAIIKLNPHDLQRILDGENKSLMANNGLHITIGKATGQKSEVSVR
jgi:hypothetical protein